MRRWPLLLAVTTMWACGGAAPSPTAKPSPPPPVVEAPPPPLERARAVALRARFGQAKDARAVLAGLDVDAPARITGANLARLRQLCAEAGDEGFSSVALACPELQRARLLARTAPPADRAAREAMVEVLGREVLLRWALAMGRARGPQTTPDPALLIRLNQGETVAQIVASLRPTGHQYARLLAAARRYRTLVEADFSYTPIPRTRLLRRGSKGPAVAALRARLAQEGFDSEPPPGKAERFERSLSNALAGFQKLHALDPAARVGPGTRRVLDLTPAQRLAAVHRALRDWRARGRRSAPMYVQINIPDFHGELWAEGTRRSRFRVVVGQSRLDDKGKRPNATPSLTSQIHTVVYNPYWNVPQRILEEEVLADPAVRDLYSPEERWFWLAERGYEVRYPGTSSEYVRQLPGPHNALGRVKLLFRNPYSIYLHDTPRKRLFGRTRRAFSHGCIRVQHPLRLARQILEWDGRYDRHRVREWLSGPEPTSIRLSRSVPIYVDYILVHVDDLGRVRFLDDLYRRRR